ncbi:hypothetical protein CVT26_009201 [Gymnopilus dilepis]|uniref:MYND-type domain-containing protein n=1 Tax=Gymnopilus dilepis TaxID=231916 RepID=A0A409WUQ0_9AGAR|nr:hypothetical protein CVT26_009201 [Gymnopilus dilepis]
MERLPVGLSPEESGLEFFPESAREAARVVGKALVWCFVNVFGREQGIMGAGRSAPPKQVRPWKLTTSDSDLAEEVGREFRRIGVVPEELHTIAVSGNSTNALMDLAFADLFAQLKLKSPSLVGTTIAPPTYIGFSTFKPVLPDPDVVGSPDDTPALRQFNRAMRYLEKSWNAQPLRVAEVETKVVRQMRTEDVLGMLRRVERRPWGLIREDADGGDVDAAFEYGLRLLTGLGCVSNRTLARVYLIKAATSPASPPLLKARAHSILVDWYLNGRQHDFRPRNFFVSAHHANEAAKYCNLSSSSSSSPLSLSPPGVGAEADDRLLISPAVLGYMARVFERQAVAHPEARVLYKEVVDAVKVRDRHYEMRALRMERKRLRQPNRYRCAAVGCGIQSDTGKMLLQCAGKCDPDKKPSYCSKACQKSDWSNHKPFCAPGLPCSVIDPSSSSPGSSSSSSSLPRASGPASKEGCYQIPVRHRDGSTHFISSSSMKPELLREQYSSSPFSSFAMSISLNCLVLGDSPELLFDVTIPKSEKVAVLKEYIKRKNTPRLDNVHAPHLEMWQVSLPVDGLDARPEHISTMLTDDRKLRLPNKRLSTIFKDGDPDDDFVHIIVKVPEAAVASVSGPSQLLRLNCFISGDRDDQIFCIEIPKDKTVDILKERIKEKWGPRLSHVNSPDLSLWQISFPIVDLPSQDPTTRGPKMRPERKLADLFSTEPDEGHIHIFVRLPGQGAPSRHSGPPPSAFKRTIISVDKVGADRKTFCETRPSDAPSNGGKPRTFASAQEDPDQHIPCNRPTASRDALPLSLLHPIFGQFEDDADHCVPTKEEIGLALEFKEVMTAIYDKEHGRRVALHNVFLADNIRLDPSIITRKVGQYTTDGDLVSGRFRFLIAELKNEVVSGSAEPYFQAILYFLETTRKLAAECVNSNLPCIFVLVFGPYVAFAGATWTDRPTVQMLSPAIPCHYHVTDAKMENMLVRHIAALRRAIPALDQYYREYEANKLSIKRNPIHPYPTSFKSEDGSDKHFRYDSHMKGRNLFFGHLEDDGETRICIKFVRHYCKEGHEFLAARGCAPTLHTVERLPGGMFMVVMADVSENYESLFSFLKSNAEYQLAEEHLEARNALSDKVRACLAEFHQAGFVHGDLRDTNVMPPSKEGSRYQFPVKHRDGSTHFISSSSMKSQFLREMKEHLDQKGVDWSSFGRTDHEVLCWDYL